MCWVFERIYRSNKTENDLCSDMVELMLLWSKTFLAPSTHALASKDIVTFIWNDLFDIWYFSLEGKILECLGCVRFLKDFEISGTFLSPLSYGENYGKFQNPVKIVHIQDVLIFSPLVERSIQNLLNFMKFIIFSVKTKTLWFSCTETQEELQD